MARVITSRGANKPHIERSAAGSRAVVVPAPMSFAGELIDARNDAIAAALDAVQYSSTADPALIPWRIKLDGRNAARADVLLIGDSLVESYPVASYADTLAQRLAADLRAEFPTTGIGTAGGRGLINIPDQGIAGVPSPLTFTGGLFDPTAHAATPAFHFGAAHTCWYANSGTSKVVDTLAAPVTSFDIIHGVGPSGGATAGYYKIDGGAAVPFSTTAGANALQTLHVASPATSTIEIGWNAAGYVILAGIREYAGDEAKGIQVHAAGHLGYDAVEWAAGAATVGGWRTSLSSLSPDVVVIQLGGNDAQTVSAATFKTNLTAFIATLRAGASPLPTVPILLAAIYDASGGATFIDDWAEYVAAMQEIAGDDDTIAFVDHSVRMPATDAADTYGLYDADEVHGTATGYARMAGTLATALGKDVLTKLPYTFPITLDEIKVNAQAEADAAAASAAAAATAETNAETAETNAETAQAAAEAAQAAAEAVGATNDTIIAGRVNDPASATSAALSATLVPRPTTDLGNWALLRRDTSDVTKGVAWTTTQEAVARALGWFIVTDRTYGAVGDNATNDTAAINAAIQAATNVIQNPGGINARGATVFLPVGTYKADILLANGVHVKGSGDGTVLRPWTTSGPAVRAPNSMQFGGLSHAHLYGYGPASRVTPYTNTNGVVGTNQAGQSYTQYLDLGGAITGGVAISTVTVAAVTSAQTIPVGATITIDVGGANVVQATVATATLLNTGGTTAIPVTTFTPANSYSVGTDVQVTGGFACGLYLPMGTGSPVSGATSGTYECTWSNLKIEMFGNHGVMAEGGTIYQAHQFSTFEQVHCRYNRDAGWYLYGFLQNNKFTRCTGITNGWNNMAIVSFLSAGVSWYVANVNSFDRCIFEGAGTYNNAGTITGVDQTVHGLYCEGYENHFSECWWEGNGLDDSAHLSTGVYMNYVASGNARNHFIGCHFDSHFIDWWNHAGTKNVVDHCDFSANGTTPPAAQKFSYIRLDAHAVIGSKNHYQSGAQKIYIASVLNPAADIEQELDGHRVFGYLNTSGTMTPGTPYATGASWTWEGGHHGWKTDNTYDIGLTGFRPRDIYAGRYLNLVGKRRTYGSAAPTTGAWVVGETVWNDTPTATSPLGWVCTVAGTPGTWVAFGQPQGGAWQAATLINSWTSGASHAAVSYRLSRDRAHVELAGLLASGAAATVAFVLDAGFRPITRKILTGYSTGNGGGRGIQVDTNGNVTVMTGTTQPISIDGMSFPLDI